MTQVSRFFVVALVATSTAMLCLVASAGTITYQANADPAGATYDGYTTEAGTQPFTWLGGATTRNDYGDTDGAKPIWVTRDNPFAGDDEGVYKMATTAADRALAASDGWTLSANVKFAGDLPSYTYGVRYWDGNANQAWGMQFKTESNGRPATVAVNYKTTTVGYVFDLTDYALDNGYHTYQLTNSAANPGVVSFSIDGVVRGSNLAPLSYANATDQVAFGDISSGDYGAARAYFTSVTWQAGQVPEPSAVMLLVTGLIGIAAYAWRKRS